MTIQGAVRRTVDFDDVHFEEFLNLQAAPLPNLTEEEAPPGAECGHPSHAGVPVAATVRVSWDVLDDAGLLRGGED